MTKAPAYQFDTPGFLADEKDVIFCDLNQRDSHMP
ncbi:MAG: hypothetical protein K0R23_712 [Lacrimispora sp.]|jgi:hypothetical protein|nr:hypothetical protein [Lacrimispora sp.]